MLCIVFPREVRLTPQQANHEVKLLQSYSGVDKHNALESIQYTSDYEFGNGCRAPPWRQIHGDICYLLVKPHDGDQLSVTANTAGVYLNKVRSFRLHNCHKKQKNFEAHKNT